MKIVINATDFKIRSEKDRKVITLPQTAEIAVIDDKKNYVEIPNMAVDVDVGDLDLKISPKTPPKRKRKRKPERISFVRSLKKRKYSRKESQKQIRNRSKRKLDQVVDLIIKHDVNMHQAIRKFYSHPGGENYKKVKAELRKRGKRMVKGKGKGRPYKIVSIRRVKRKTR